MTFSIPLTVEKLKVDEKSTKFQMINVQEFNIYSWHFA